MDCWKEGHLGKCRSHHIISSAYTINLTRHCLCWPWSPGWGSVRFPYCKITPPPDSPLQKEVTTCSPLFRGELCVTSLRTKYLYKSFRIPLHKRFVPSPPFIYSTIYLYHYGFVNVYFVLWVTTQYVLLNLFSCSNCPSFGHHELFQSAPGSLWHTTLNWFRVSILTNSPSDSGPRTALWEMWLKGVPGALQAAESHPFLVPSASGYRVTPLSTLSISANTYWVSLPCLLPARCCAGCWAWRACLEIQTWGWACWGAGENMYVVNGRQEEKNPLAFYLSLVSSPETRKEHVKNWERTCIRDRAGSQGTWWAGLKSTYGRSGIKQE